MCVLHDVVMRRYFKSYQYSRYAEHLPVFPALQQPKWAVLVGNQAGAIRYRTKTKRGQSVF